MKLDEWDWWQKQEALEKLGLDKSCIFNSTSHTVISSRTTK